ncbi:hypothetical protein QCE62_05600 [Caballeronia sp. LZ033]|uniref:hypothetical protein n=1 Tax=Caballeronia sp. LZ033 TaxID=3038566 RepID=UPI00286334DB|nr:hypothetical protein [Caballeronia sp. LZ033]MDR5813064.1 hypothetical protein [Caballeronia sp. LZ033]
MTLDDVRQALGRLSEDALAELDALLEPPENSLMCLVLDGDRDGALNRYFGEHGHLPEITMVVQFEGTADAGESITSRDTRLKDLVGSRR